MFIFLYRAIKFAVQSFFRNFWLSLVTIIILVLTLFSVTIVGGVNVIADKTIESVKGKVDVSAYFKPEVTEENVINVQNRLESLSQVKSVTYISRDQALEKFKEKHKDDPEILDSISQLDTNPLGATLVIKANNIEDYQSILTVLDNPDYAEMIQDKDKNAIDNQRVIDRLANLSHRIRNIGMIISFIFIIIAILIVFNTIRINIYTHREEIGIMKLVGASNWFVRLPFLVESLIYALLAVAICLAILYPLLGVIAPQVDNFFEGYNLDLVSYFHANFGTIVGWQLAFVVILSILSSLIAIGRYLRV